MPTPRSACSPRRSTRRSRAWSAKPRGAATFAGHFAERAPRRRSRPIEAQRLYELTDRRARRDGERSAPARDRRRSADARRVGPRRSSRRPAPRPRARGGERSICGIAARAVLGLGRRRAGVDGAARRTPAAGVARVQYVYTPPAAPRLRLRDRVRRAPEPSADRTRAALRALHRPRATRRRTRSTAASATKPVAEILGYDFA